MTSLNKPPLREMLVVGHIVKPQGIKGEVKVKAESAPERFLRLGEVVLGESADGRTVKVLSARVRDGMAFLTLEGVTSREDAEKLRETPLCVPRSALPKLPKGEYYICDLFGCEVITEEGEKLGEIAEVFQAGGNDCWAVKGEKSFIFPAVKHVLAEVDVENRRVTVISAALAEVAVFDD